MENYSTILFMLAVWFKCYHCQDSVSIQPSPVAKVYEGDPLTLTCTYTGSYSPLTVNWRINNVTTDMSVQISTCEIVGSPLPDYKDSRCNFTCSNPYTLKIKQTSLADDGVIWGCTVGRLLFPSPPVSQTRISIHCQDGVSIQPSPVAQAYDGDPLTLVCTYTGLNSPLTVKWYRNNVATDMSIDIRNCTIVGTPAPAYEVTRYSFTCSNSYTLKISQISFADDRDIWGCTVGLSSFPSPCVSQTNISIMKRNATTTKRSVAGMDNLPHIVGVTVGGFTLFLLVIIIICCYFPGCYLYSCCRKEERIKDSKQIRCNQDASNHTNTKYCGTRNANVPNKI